MSTNKTENLNLHSWVADDPFRRSEFNENFAAIDAAMGDTLANIAAKAKIAIGTYAGTGTTSSEQTTQNIALGFRPKFLIINTGEGKITEYNTALAFDGCPCKSYIWGGNYTLAEITDDGFTVNNYYSSAHGTITPYTNNYGTTYVYAAIG